MPLLFEPLAPSEYDLNRDMGNFNYKAIARLKPGVTLSQANAELEALQKAYTLSAHLPLHFGIALTPLEKDVASGVSGALWLLLAAVGAVLLIACVNLANLQLARAVNAERETAVRAALGASRSQLVRSRLTESLVLAFAGGAAGTALAFGGVRLLIAWAPANIPRLDEVRVSLPVLIFSGGLSIAAAIIFGILPSLHSLRVAPQAALQANSTRAAGTQRSRRTRSLMVAAQVACTVVLLIVTSLVLRSLSHLLRQDRGFDASHVTLAQADLVAPQYDDAGPKGNAARLAFADSALTALGQLPGVQSVALTSVTPLTGETWVDTLSRPDHPVPAGKQPPINVRWINPSYLTTMLSPLVAGRNITAADRTHPYVALISERTAREGFPGENPIGRKISDIVPDENPVGRKVSDIVPDDQTVTMIGVVADTRINGLKDDAAMVYLPYWAYTPMTLSFLVRSSQSSDALIPEMRRAIWQIDPQVAIPTLKSMDEQVSDSVAGDRFQAMVLSGFWRGRIVPGFARSVWRACVLGHAAPAGVRHPHRLGFWQERDDRAGAAAGCISRSPGHRCWTHDGVDRAALGPQSPLSNARHGPNRTGRQHIAALGCRYDRSDCTGPARSIHRSDARIADGVKVVITPTCDGRQPRD